MYNGSEYIESCIASIENNSIKDYEIILIDDGSSDNSPQICDTLTGLYDNIKCIHIKNNGVSYSRNLGIKMASGKYVSFVDQDDYLPGNFVEACSILDAYNPDAVYFKWNGTNKRDSLFCQPINLIDDVYEEKSQNFLIANLLHCTNPSVSGYSLVFPWGGIYNREVLLKNQIYFNPDVLICEDVYFNISFLKKSNKIILSNRTTYFYYNNAKSAGKGYNPDASEISIVSNKLIKDIIGDRYSDASIQYGYAYSVIYRYWWCIIADFYHLKNKDSLVKRAKRMRNLSQKQMYIEAFSMLDRDMLLSMPLNMRIFMYLINRNKFYLASLLSKVRIILKGLMI